MKSALAAFFGAFLATLVLQSCGAQREQQSYGTLYAERDSLGREVEMCRATTTRMGARLATLETHIARWLPRRAPR